MSDISDATRRDGPAVTGVSAPGRPKRSPTPVEGGRRIAKRSASGEDTQ